MDIHHTQETLVQLICDLELSRWLNLMKFSRAISHVRCLYETDVSRTISVITITIWHIRSLMMILEMSVSYRHVTWLISREEFVELVQLILHLETDLWCSCFPPTLHKMQPLGVAWYRNYPRQVVTQVQIAAIFGIEYDPAATSKTEFSAFATTNNVLSHRLQLFLPCVWNYRTFHEPGTSLGDHPNTKPTANLTFTFIDDLNENGTAHPSDMQS